MQDLLGRNIKDGDMCIGMAIGRNSSGMHLGVMKGNSVVYLGKTYKYQDDYLCKSCTSNTYLIANPTEEELIIKDKIQKLLDKEAEERKRKANMKTIPLKELEVGGIYKSTQGQYFMYLGKRKVTLSCKDSYGNRVLDEREGNCFIFIYNVNEDKESFFNRNIYINTYHKNHNIDILKGNKKLTELVRKLDLEFPLVRETETTAGYWNRDIERYKLTVE